MHKNETMMRAAAPCWFSIEGEDYKGDILNPDYCFKFYKKIKNQPKLKLHI